MVEKGRVRLLAIVLTDKPSLVKASIYPCSNLLYRGFTMFFILLSGV